MDLLDFDYLKNSLYYLQYARTIEYRLHISIHSLTTVVSVAFAIIIFTAMSD